MTGLPIDWHVAIRPQPGQRVCGDNYVVEPYPGGVLLGLVDGLGHGIKAANASQTAVDALKKRPHEPVTEIIEQCHRATRQTRGSVLSLASLKHDGAMTWIGVGNVTGVVVRNGGTSTTREYLLVRGGVVGYRLPPLRTFALSLNPGDTLIFASDGIRSGFLEDIPVHLSPRELAENLLRRFGRDTDDASILVARFTNSS